MGISTSLNIALTGLKSSQLQLDLTANNVANSSSPDYSRRRVQTSALVVGDRTFGVMNGTVQREIDLQVQRQWRTATANSAYATTRSDYLTRLDSSFGGPKNPNSLDALFNGFKKSFEKLAASPDNGAARIEAVASAETLAQSLRSLSETIQTARQDAETSIGSAVTEVNTLLMRISKLDKEIISVSAGDNSTAALQDERDAAIDDLAKLIDIKVEDQSYGAIAIRTTAGTLLYDDTPVQLRFDERATLSPGSLYSVVDSERSVGAIVIESGPGAGYDLFRDNSIRSGKIAALRELRDDTLVSAQSQLDALAAQMAEAISNKTVTGTAVTSGTAQGFSVDLSGLKPGNRFTLEYTDASGTRTVSFVARATAGDVGDDYTPDPNDTVVTLDLSGASGTLANQVAAALGASFQVSDLGGNVLQVLDDGTSAMAINSLSASISVDTLQSGSKSFALFIDSATGQGFTGLTGANNQKPGFASRIYVNPTVKADPAYLVKYTATTAPNDTGRPRAVIDALSEAKYLFDPDVGIGTQLAPFSGTVEQFLKQVLSSQGSRTQAAQQLAEGQGIVTANIEERYNGSRKVDLDAELSRLIELQTAYQANARVLTAAREMLDMLMQAI
jgi:flagellar hook-associated protein 1 FlgK